MSKTNWFDELMDDYHNNDPRGIAIQKLTIEKYRPILEKLNAYLIGKFNYRKAPASFHRVNKNIIDVSRKKISAYIRLFDKPSGQSTPTIVIARIAFDKSRKGYGTDLFRLISEIAIQYDYGKIELENCASQSGIAFANKLGFKRIEQGYNYSIDTSELVEYFIKSN